MKKIIFIAYFLQVDDGIGSIRSRALLALLKDQVSDIKIVEKDSHSQYPKIKFLFDIFRAMIALPSNVYLSCGPFFQLFMVSLFSFIFRHRLYIDLRDPWSFNIKTGYGSGVCNSKVKLFIAEYIERIAYIFCEKFIVCTYGMKEKYEGLFMNGEKLNVVLNGHNLSKENLLNIADNYNRNIIQVICVGKFACYTKNAEKIINKLISDFRKHEINFRIHFIGTDSETTRLFSKNKSIIIEPKISYNQAVRRMNNSDLGISMVRNEDYEFGTKVFDYIALGIPIYDCFSSNKQFSNFFKDYLVSDVSSIKKYEKDYTGKFYRNNQLKVIVEFLRN